MKSPVGWRETSPELKERRQEFNTEELCHLLNKLSRETLPVGAGDVFAAVDSKLVGIWYSPSDLEREFVRFNALLLFKVYKEKGQIVCIRRDDTRVSELSYLTMHLIPALILFFQASNWTVNSC